MKKIMGGLMLGGIVAMTSFSLGYSVVDGTVLKVDLSQDKLVVTKTNLGEAKSLLDLITSVGGVAGVNGAYFCPAERAYSRCGQDNNSKFERIIHGILHAKFGKDTGTRGVIGVTKNNEALFVQNNFGYVGNYKNNTNKDRYDEMYYGIGNFPILLDQGRNVLSFYGKDEIDGKMKSKQSKEFICHTQDGKTMYMGSVPAKTIYEMPEYLKNKYGCWNAINLDAGGSTAVYGNGKYLAGPGRNIVDAYVIVGKEDKQEIKQETKQEVKKTIKKETPVIKNHTIEREETKVVENTVSCSLPNVDLRVKMILAHVIKNVKKESHTKQRKLIQKIAKLKNMPLKPKVKAIFSYLHCALAK